MKTKIFIVLIILIVFSTLSCETEVDSDIKINLISILVDGKENVYTTKFLDLTFSSKNIISDFDLKPDDITFDPGTTGAVMGDLERKEYPANLLPEDQLKRRAIYKLALKNVSSTGEIYITIKKSGYRFSYLSYAKKIPKKIPKKIYYYFNANIPAELAAEWFMGQDFTKTPQYTIKSDGTLLVNNQDNKLQVSVKDDIITFYNNKEEAGTAKFSISENTLTITEATSGMVIINGTFYKKTDS